MGSAASYAQKRKLSFLAYYKLSLKYTMQVVCLRDIHFVQSLLLKRSIMGPAGLEPAINAV